MTTEGGALIRKRNNRTYQRMKETMTKAGGFTTKGEVLLLLRVVDDEAEICIQGNGERAWTALAKYLENKEKEIKTMCQNRKEKAVKAMPHNAEKRRTSI